MAHKLREWRKAKGLNQKEAAALLETVQPVLSRVERGEREPSTALARKLIEHGAITAEDFFASSGQRAA